MRSFIFYIITLILICGCQVQKRRYQKGYYVNAGGIDLRKKSIAPGSLSYNSSRIVKSRRQLKTGDADSCATLVFTDGTEIKARILDMDAKVVRYRFCDEPVTAVHVSRRSTILRIHYPGEKPVERKETPVKVIVEPPKLPENQPPVEPPIQPASRDTASPKKTNDTTSRKNTSACDQITFRDGTEKAGNVLEIGQTEIRYKACDMPNGPVFVRNKSDVFMIVYKDGHREVFKEEEESFKTIQQSDEQRMPPSHPVKRYSAVTPFVFSLMGIWPMWIAGSMIGLIWGAIYLKKAQEDPAAYPQEGFARAAVVIGIIMLAIITAILVISFL